MCGIVGISSYYPVNQDLYDALTVLQHRGQDAAGIVTYSEGTFHQRKGVGLVRDVFYSKHMKSLKGNLGIGHLRYPTAGSSTSPSLVQPFYVNSPCGISLAHNGNLTNLETLQAELSNNNLRHLNTNSDSEVLLNVFANELQMSGKNKLTKDDFFDAVGGVHERCEGAYAVVTLIAGYGLLAFRDPNGIRPLCYGYAIDKDGKKSYMVASESVALHSLGYTLIADVKPGEAIYIDRDNNYHLHKYKGETQLQPCVFEYVYFARPDSIIDDVSVYKSRLRMGEKLAAKILREWPDHDIDAVVPVPDTGRVAGQALANELGVKFREGLIKNRYIGRTFIMPGQHQRKRSVKQKLNTIGLEFEGKNILLVDDSIVRGTTCQQLIDMAREAGAKKVYFASVSPAVRYPNVYGIDMPSSDELVAYDKTVEEVQTTISADKLIYQDLDDLLDCCREGNSDIDSFESSVFTGHYISGKIDDEYLNKLHEARNDKSKDKMEDKESMPFGLYNNSN
jgi:amidophosphoribosyltransferase